ncbi:hypothetical protein Dsin_010783 [Dipteronia sinensis]|uniref:DUF7788 domain-containing protein n=1 Tax=Dipteronia sinensis TaxID=43782 RepID=A0AAE0ATF2_9ROSI|nr:hypothetical protein Dsin_010783 [Dipteronia sinensis]
MAMARKVLERYSTDPDFKFSYELEEGHEVLRIRMNGTPIDVSVALGMLISELSKDPWKGKLITFSEKPQLQYVQGDNLMSKTRFV